MSKAFTRFTAATIKQQVGTKYTFIKSSNKYTVKFTVTDATLATPLSKQEVLRLKHMLEEAKVQVKHSRPAQVEDEMSIFVFPSL